MSPELMYQTFRIEERMRLHDPYLALRRRRRLPRPPLSLRIGSIHRAWRRSPRRSSPVAEVGSAS